MAAATHGPANEFRDIWDPRTEGDEGTESAESSHGESARGKCAQQTTLVGSGARGACARIQIRGHGKVLSGPRMDMASESTVWSMRVQTGGSAVPRQDWLSFIWVWTRMGIRNGST